MGSVFSAGTEINHMYFSTSQVWVGLPPIVPMKGNTVLNQQRLLQASPCSCGHVPLLAEYFRAVKQAVKQCSDTDPNTMTEQLSCREETLGTKCRYGDGRSQRGDCSSTMSS